MTTLRLVHHYAATWGKDWRSCPWTRGPVHELPAEFQIVEFALPGSQFIYATCGMSSAQSGAVELHIRSPQRSDQNVELLAVIAHYHLNQFPIGLGDTVFFGRPWLPQSTCSYGLISLPYLDGPKLMEFAVSDQEVAQCCWLIPITEREREFKIEHGLEALEERFEKAFFNYLNPFRSSVV